MPRYIGNIRQVLSWVDAENPFPAKVSSVHQLSVKRVLKGCNRPIGLPSWSPFPKPDRDQRCCDDQFVPGDVASEEGLISAADLSPAGKSGLVVLGFIDVQINGFDDVDFT